MKPLKFIKMHGLGNDFIIIDSRDNINLYTNGLLNLTTEDIGLICHRNFGIGCDQLLLIEPSTHKHADFNYRIYNKDGSIAGNCGNGARCVVQYLLSKTNNQDKLTLNIDSHLITGSKIDSTKIRVNIGYPSFAIDKVGYMGDANSINNYQFQAQNGAIINFAIASIGNPHAIINVNNLENEEELAQLSREIQESGLFQYGVNVNFYNIIEGIIHLRTYERGCGFTLACGTGACVTASYAILNNLAANPALVNMKGGQVEITLDKTGEIFMTGDAIEVFRGEMLI